MKPSKEGIEAAHNLVIGSRDDVSEALAAFCAIDVAPLEQEIERLKKRGASGCACVFEADDDEKLIRPCAFHSQLIRSIRQLAQALEGVLACAVPMEQEWEKGKEALKASEPWLEWRRNETAQS